MRVLNLLGTLLYHCAFGVARLGSLFYHWALDAIYGAPRVAAPMGSIAQSLRQAPASMPARNVHPADQMTAANSVANSVEATIGKPDTGELQASQEPVGASRLAVSGRVRTAQLCGPRGVIYGVMWLYLYPDLRIARRVLKVMDTHLAKSLKKDRFFFVDVPYEPASGYMVLMDQLHAECKVLLDKRRPEKLAKRLPVARPARMAQPPASAPVRAIEPAPPAVPVARPATVVAPSAPAVAAPVAPAARRRVNGDEYKGVVTVAGRTRRGTGDASYETFCLTINDGAREVPLFGNELERQAADLGVKPGDRIKVIFMGKQPTTIPGSTRPSYKNLYQLTRMEGA